MASKFSEAGSASSPIEPGSMRERLLLTAERLIAEEGVVNVSMRRINAAAGTKNLSAVHYHFGSLDAIVAAIFSYRTPILDQRRAQLLKELASSGRQNDLFSILEAVVWPLAELLLARESDNHYVRFVSAVMRTPSFDNWAVLRKKDRRSLMRVYSHLRRILAQVPKEVLHVRMITGIRQVVYTLADTDQLIRERHPHLRDALILFHSSDLVARLAAGLQAPVRDSTRMAFRLLEAAPMIEQASLFGMDAMRAMTSRREKI